MVKRPNVLWLMSDQHHADCAGFAGHPNVKTPALDCIAERGVQFRRAFSNNPICSPSRITFMTGQYMHTHRMFGNNHAEYPEPNPETLACQFRRYGYQTGLFGKSHMIRRWDEDGFERIRYVDLCDAKRDDPTTCHYFNYLVENGLGDMYEDGAPGKGMEYTLDGSGPARLPYEHSNERYTGRETLRFLEERDENRPFFIHMSFERPHAPIAPAPEHFGMYDPEEMVLPDSAVDWFENDFAGKPEFQRSIMRGGNLYPLADKDPMRLKRCLASYYALITAIDSEIGQVLDKLDAMGELENTVVFYTADHGDFAGDHGIFHKNFGIYESIQRIPFLLSWPGGPRGEVCDGLVESVDWYPTLCGLCGVPVPEGREGMDVVPVASGESSGKDAVWCEWDWANPAPGGKISAIRTERYRLVFYEAIDEGELYDHEDDPGEVRNRWGDPEYADVRHDLTERLFRFTMQYRPDTSYRQDRKLDAEHRYAFTRLIHKHRRRWTRMKEAYEEVLDWSPEE